VRRVFIAIHTYIVGASVAFVEAYGPEPPSKEDVIKLWNIDFDSSCEEFILTEVGTKIPHSAHFDILKTPLVFGENK
jgi:hypothetical protein